MKKSMEITSLCIFCVALTGVIRGEGVLPDDSLNASLGASVMFSTTVPPQGPPLTLIDWKFNGKTIIFFNEIIMITPGYEDKANISLLTGALELRNLTVNDSGQYRVIITPRQQASQEGAATLNVYVPVSDIVVSQPDGDLVEFNSTVRLSCSSSGSSLSFFWLNGSSEVVVSNRVNVTDEGSTLVVANVTRYDRGPFRCHVFNPVSNGTSDPVNLTINYGPENTAVRPENQYYETGSNVTLTCSADSMPPARFGWFRSGDQLSDTQELRLYNLQENESGNYSCQAFNPQTLRYAASQVLAVTILERISNVSLVPSSTTPIEEAPLDLTCSAGGSVFTRLWWKDGVRLNLTDNVTLADGGRVLSFTGLRKRDNGEYLCEAVNPIGSSGAAYTLEVSYGPEKVTIEGPAQIQIGESLTLKCWAESNPAATYRWSLKEAELSTSPELTFVVHNSSDSGNYTCHAVNSVTGRTSSAVHAVSVTEKKPAPLACSGGCIAGITVGCVVVVAMVAAIGGYIYYRRKGRKKKESVCAADAESDGQDNTAYSGSQELNYASVDFSQNSGGVRNNSITAPMELETKTQYAQIKKHRPATPPPYDIAMQRMQREQPEHNYQIRHERR